MVKYKLKLIYRCRLKINDLRLQKALPLLPKSKIATLSAMHK